MQPNKLTNNAQMALKLASEEAIRRNHQVLEPEHVLWALTGNVEGIIKPLLARMEIPVEPLRAQMDLELQRIPAVKGGGGQGLVGGDRLQAFFEAAEDERGKRLGAHRSDATLDRRRGCRDPCSGGRFQ